MDITKKIDETFYKLNKDQDHKKLALLWKNYLNIKIKRLLLELDKCNNIFDNLDSSKITDIDLLTIEIIKNSYK